MILLKKAIRSIWDNKKAYIACILLITIGIFIHDITGIATEVFSVAKDKYYKEYRLADVFAKVKAMPVTGLADLQRLQGIEEAAGRYVYDARVIMPGSDKIITLRINSVDTAYEGMPLNGIIVTGNDFGEATDIMVAKSFLASHNMEIGDSLRLIIEGKEYSLTICATADSPEYVYAIKDANEILPDAEAFSYAYMSQESLWAFVNQYGIYNDVGFALEKGVTYESVRAALEDRLKNYGLQALYIQDDQVSVAMVKSELDGIAAMSGSVPMVFMLMSVVVLYLMLKRVIEQERTQIGTLKAFGYSNNAILLHYILYGAVTGVIGGILGTILSVAVSDSYIEIFKGYFNLPTENGGIPMALLLKGVLISVASGILGGYFGARGILKLNPADAMRPVAPKAVKSDILKKLPFLYMLLNSGGNMALRSIARNKMRSFVIILGIMFSFGILAFMGSYSTMIDFMMLNQFSKVQLFDAKMIFNTPQDYGLAVEAAYKLQGVTLAEGILELPVELSNKNLKASINLIGLEEDSSLYKIYDNERGDSFRPPGDGVILNDGLAKKLDAKKGDVLYLSSSLLEDDVKVVVSDVAIQNLGQAGFMEIDALSELFHLKKPATSVIVKTDDMAYLKSILDESKNLAVVEDKVTTLKNYTAFMDPYNALIYIMEIMAAVVAFAIIYNTSTISLSERKREYATLRVMGMHTKEVGDIMAFEYWVLCFLGVLLGVPFTIFLKDSMASLYTMDAFTFPSYTPLSAYLTGAAGCMAAVFFANRSSVRQIKKFDMVEVLKERE